MPQPTCIATLDVDSMFQSADFTMLALDIEAFHSAGRNGTARKRLRAYMRLIANRSLAEALPAAPPTVLDRGDGLMVLLPGYVRPADLLVRVVPRLATYLDCYNSEVELAEVMRLRLVIHTGEVEFDDGGFISDDLTYAFRLLHSDMMRRRLATTAQPIALAVTDSAYREVKVAGQDRQAPIGQLGSLAFKNKETEGLAWTATLGRCVPHGTPLERHST